MATRQICGANFAVRRSWLAKNRFATAFGRIGNRMRIGEDTALLSDIRKQGGTLLYWPAAVVHHRIETSRMTKSYFRRWHCDIGQMQGELSDRDHPRTLFGVPYRVYRELIHESCRWARSGIRGQPAFIHELHIWRLLAFARACLRCRLAAATLSVHDDLMMEALKTHFVPGASPAGVQR
jgi:hypothetical protein